MENKKIFQFVYSYTYPEICSFVEKCRTDLANEFHITFKEWKDKKFISQKYSEQFKTTEVASPPPTPGAIQKKIITDSNFEIEGKVPGKEKQLEL